MSGRLADEALAAARDIAAATARGSVRCPQGVAPEAVPIWEATLRAGRAGQCLLHAYLALHGAGATYATEAMALLAQATDAAAALPLSTSLFLGFPGIAWVMAHLAGRVLPAEEDSLRDVDRALLRFLRRTSQAGNHDLYHGLTGIGVYALERLPRPAARRCLEAVVDHLSQHAERSDDGAAFLSPPARIAPRYAADFPGGTYPLGMGQGVAGVIALLGSASRARVALHGARPLLTDAVRWLMARERPDGSDYRFPTFHHPKVEPLGSRLGWSMGDLGIAASLVVAARGAGEPAWEAEARRLAGAAAERSLARRRITDVGFCQGAAGVAHVFNRLYQATGQRDLGKAARLWFRRVLALCRPGIGVSGFRTAAMEGGGWLDDPGLLDGTTGVGLALLAATSHVEPAWDRVFLLPSDAGAP